MASLNAAKVEADNSKLIEIIRNHFIDAPSRLPYGLNHPEVRDPSQGQSAFVDKILNQSGGGFFVDCGAHAGETFSNTLFLERFRNWTGILIEANPTVYKELKTKNRKAFTLNACLYGKSYPSVVSFLENSWWGKIFEGNYSKAYRGIGGKGRYVHVQCFPLYSILLALNQTRVDYFSLDVEGAEEDVLDSIPWDKVDIRMMSIEYDKWPGGNCLLDYSKKKKDIMKFNIIYQKFIYLLPCVLLWVLYHSLHYYSSSEKMTLVVPETKKTVVKSRNIQKDIHFDYKNAMASLNAAQVEVDNSKLIEMIRNHFIDDPSRLPYKLNHPEVRDPSQGQTAFVDKTLNQAEGGFFIDCGAHAGETFSNTLFLERYRNWTGILIETNPTVYKQLKMKNRKAFTLNSCLHGKSYPSMVSFLEDSWWGKVFEGNFSKAYRGIGGKGRYVHIQCFPLYSILLALNQTRVDYFSLDVEGAEEGVLDSIPWDKVDIRMMSIEYNKWPGGKSALKSYMEKRGYKYMTDIKAMAAADIIVLKDDQRL
ncbi:uncharacterized protein LOC123531033 [Mercenaria mercenaria]|uniref:uncharacterized protein LOC123531033 n=1 Tax=Mercenaria mercenaria TaxID=6596 RepID=UPI00234E6AA7|nr:uncharacterized protein LOC123531033 [Mercenaria mercenaria]